MFPKLRFAIILIIVATLPPCDSNLFSQTLNDPTVTGSDNFGFAVATDGEQVVIGARRDDLFGTNTGQAHLFELTSNNLLRTFNDPTPTIQDNFGAAVDVDSGRVLIGAPQDSTNTFLGGQAHLFSNDSGEIIHTFDDPTVTSSDLFAAAVALHADRVVIGAPGDDTHGNGVGQAHLFNATTGLLIATLNDPTVTGFDGFGEAVAINENWVAIGAPGDDTDGFGVGQVHLFNAANGEFVRTLNDPTVTEADLFGTSVALFGDWVLVGASGDDMLGNDVGQAYLFNAISGMVVQTFDPPEPTEDSSFGFSVSVLAEHVLVGSPKTAENSEVKGKSFLFDLQSATLLDTFEGSKADVDDEFGFSVSLTSSRAVIGAPFDDTNGNDVGIVEVFDVANQVLIGDVNLDQVVDLLDISPFVSLVVNGQFQVEADTNLDGVVDLLDVSPFVSLLTGS